MDEKVEIKYYSRNYLGDEKVLQVEFKRDMQRNYMIIKGGEEEPYALKMLVNNLIFGLLKLELRVVDNINQYYYDVTAQQPITELFQKGQIRKKQIQQIMCGILESIKRAGEYFLFEDDYVLEPQYIFVKQPNLEVSLCYVAGYGCPIEEQITEVISYLMNQVDYEDETAVVLIYELYHMSRREGCTLQMLFQTLYESPKGENVEKSKRQMPTKSEDLTPYVFYKENNISTERADDRPDTNLKKVHSITEEQQNFWWLSLILLLVLGIIIWVYQKELLSVCMKWKDRGGKYINFLAILGVTVGSIAFICICLWKPYKKIEDIFSFKNKMLPFGFREKKREVHNKNIDNGLEKDKEREEQETLHSIYRWMNEFDKHMDTEKKSMAAPREQTELLQEGAFEQEKTRILEVTPDKQEYYLAPLENNKYETIVISVFPFFLGKLNGQVNHKIDSPVISRVHAKIEKEGECFFLMDLNSTNGTYINQVKIESNKRTEIRVGDELTFANIPYYFTK